MGEITRCKVKCHTVSQTTMHSNEVIHTAEFHAVHSGSKENEDFFKWTPTLSVKTGLIKQPFEVGKEYYLDFIPVDGEA